MRKVVMLARLYWPHVGGVENHVLGLCSRLKKRGIAITLITEQYSKELKLKEYHEGVKILRVPYSNIGSKLKTWRWMCQHRKEFESAELVHAHDVGWWYVPIKWIHRSTPFYITFHGYEPRGLPRFGAILSRKIVELSTNGSIVVGEFIKKWYWAKPTYITYGAQDLKSAPLPQKQSAVFVGRIEADTGIFTYLRALRYLHPELTLDVYGEGKDLNKAQTYVKKYGLPVAFHGLTLKPSEVIRKSRFVFTSQYLTILAAMQTKRLVIATYSSSLKRDYLECHPMKNSMIIAEKASDLVEKMNELHEEDETEKIEKAYEWAMKQTWMALEDKYLTLWQIN